MENQKVFRIGVAMAGAVSAGAYTAGVLDYLIEALQRWEIAKEKNRSLGPEHPNYNHEIPMHDVILDCLGGASAGGMTSAIAALSFFEKFNLDGEDPNQPNRLYDAWVNLNDAEGITLLQMLQNDDIVDNNVPSLLNSTAIEKIARKAKNVNLHTTPDKTNWPGFISKEMEVILTICSLRGIPVEINFSGEDQSEAVPAHKMYLHKGVAHFSISTAEEKPKHLLPLDPKSEADKETLIQSAMATGAFPVGLTPRNLEVKFPYLKSHIKRMFENEDINVNWGMIPIIFDFTAVDGGTINNEPFEEVLKVLEERYQEDIEKGTIDVEKDQRNYALIMIDPFPDFAEENEDNYEGPKNVNQVLPSVLSAIHRQAMIKESELSKGFSNDITRAMIFPVRRAMEMEKGKPVYKKQKHPIACGSLEGFGGFFYKNFREHDFHLGRKNCQSFLRKHFMFEMPEASEAERVPFYKNWEKQPQMVERFQYLKNEIPQFPIIPDLSVLKAMSDDPKENGTLPDPEWQRIPLKELKRLKKPMRKRVSKVFAASFRSLIAPASSRTEAEDEAAKKFKKEVRHIMQRHLNSNFFTPVVKWILMSLLLLLLVMLSPILIFLLVIGWTYMINMITNNIFWAIVTDFKKRDLLEEKS